MGDTPTAIPPADRHAGVAELVDARHSKCRSQKECRFDSDRPHQHHRSLRDVRYSTTNYRVTRGSRRNWSIPTVGDLT